MVAKKLSSRKLAHSPLLNDSAATHHFMPRRIPSTQCLLQQPQVFYHHPSEHPQHSVLAQGHLPHSDLPTRCSKPRGFLRMLVLLGSTNPRRRSIFYTTTSTKSHLLSRSADYLVALQSILSSPLGWCGTDLLLSNTQTTKNLRYRLLLSRPSRPFGLSMHILSAHRRCLLFPTITSSRKGFGRYGRTKRIKEVESGS